jgi:putative ABC transport system permease protein
VLTRLLEGLLFGVTATDPANLAGAALLLFGAAMVASFVPARRAAGISSVRALRGDD